MSQKPDREGGPASKSFSQEICVRLEALPIATPREMLARGPRIVGLLKCSQILNLHRLDLIGQFKSENTRVEVELAVKRALDVFSLTKPVLLAFESHVGHRQTFLAQGVNHHLRLIRRHHL